MIVKLWWLNTSDKGECLITVSGNEDVLSRLLHYKAYHIQTQKYYCVIL